MWWVFVDSGMLGICEAVRWLQLLKTTCCGIGLARYAKTLSWHTHTRLTALFPGLTRSADTRKVKPIWILPKQETVSGSGISWAVCKSAPRSTEITMPAPHHSVFYRHALPAAQPTASKHWRQQQFSVWIWLKSDAVHWPHTRHTWDPEQQGLTSVDRDPTTPTPEYTQEPLRYCDKQLIRCST